MKVLVVLVLAVFTGCNADLFKGGSPRTKLEELSDKFWDFAATATKPVEEFFDRMGETKFGEAIESHLEKGTTTVMNQMERVDGALGGTAGKFLEELAASLSGVVMSLETSIDSIEKKLEPVAETVAPVAEKMFSTLTEKTEHVRNMASPYVQKLVERVDSWSKELPVRLDTLYDSIYSRK